MSRDLRRAEAAFFQTHALSEEQFEAMKQMLTIFAQHLGKHVGCWQGANHNGDPPCVASAKEFVREMAGGRVSMRDAAKHVHLSPSYFCKLFRKATG